MHWRRLSASTRPDWKRYWPHCGAAVPAKSSTSAAATGNCCESFSKDKQFDQIVGLDVSIRSLEIANKRLKLDRLPDRQAERLKLIHGSLIYRDKRLEGFDAAAVVEVIEHLDPPRLSALERVLFEFARPQVVVLTTPNREYNVMWETTSRWPISPLRSPFRVDSARVSRVGQPGGRATRLLRSLSSCGAGR